MPAADHQVTVNYKTPCFVLDVKNGLIRSGQPYFGSFPIASDRYDVFFFNLAAKGNVQIDLMDIPAGRDYNLYLFSGDRVLESFSGSVDNQNK